MPPRVSSVGPTFVVIGGKRHGHSGKVVVIAIPTVIVTVAPSVCKWDSNRGLMRETALHFGCSIGRLVDRMEYVGPLGVRYTVRPTAVVWRVSHLFRLTTTIQAFYRLLLCMFGSCSTMITLLFFTIDLGKDIITVGILDCLSASVFLFRGV